MAEFDVTWRVKVTAEDDAAAERVAKAAICGDRKWWLGGRSFPRFRSAAMPRTRPVALTVPFVGMVNGTSKEAMLKLYLDAFRAMDQAVEAAKKCAPRYCDYYTQGEMALPRAVDDHYERIQRLVRVREEYGRSWIAVYEQAGLGPHVSKGTKSTEAAE